MTDLIMEPVTQQQETITKQKNPLRIEQGRKLVEYNKCKKEELKRLNDQITKQDDILEHKPRPDTSTYVYAGGLNFLGLAIGGYLLYNKFKKLEQNLIDVPPLRCVKAWVQNLMKNGIQNLICMHFNLLFCKNHHEILTVNVNHHC